MTSDEILAQVLDLLQREGAWPMGRLSAVLTSMTMTYMN